jgi:hypothetical protein
MGGSLGAGTPLDRVHPCERRLRPLAARRVHRSVLAGRGPHPLSTPRHAAHRRPRRRGPSRRARLTITLVLTAALVLVIAYGLYRVTRGGQGSAPSTTTTTTAHAGGVTVGVSAAMGKTLPVADPSGTGITKVTVYGLSTSVPVPAGVTPLQAGASLDAADIGVCAGTNGAVQGPQLALFELVSTKGASVQSTPFTSKAPNLASSTSVAANQCVRGFLTFTVPAGFIARTVVYTPDADHVYGWRVP